MKAVIRLGMLLSGTLLSGCILTPGATQSTSSSSGSSTSPTPAPTSSAAPGVRAVRIYFQASQSSSFTQPNVYTTGTAVGAGNGLQAIRLYNADGSLLANGTTDTNWPAWLTSFEIGLSGTSNAAASEPHCANFVQAAESTGTASCQTAAGVSFSCVAPINQFRVSEWDCTSASPGNGGANDGIYLRAIFNRSQSALGPTENILATLEYTASALNASPQNPMKCYNGGIFSPEACADFTWRVFLKHTPTESIQSFLVLVPPISSSSMQAGTGLAAKQFYLPLAADASLTTLQISRTGSSLSPTSTVVNPQSATPTSFSTMCQKGANSKGDSPLCAGMVFYSLTFYRI